MAGNAPPAVTRLALIRHGQAQTYVDQVIGGHRGCTGLSDLGRRQAAALRDRLARTGELASATALYSSILPRAVETADIIAPVIGGAGTPIVRDRQCDLCEQHVGDEIDGLTWQELRDRYGPPVENGYEPWAPGAESWAEFVARVGRMLLRLGRDHAGETVVVACHGGVVDASFSVLGGLAASRRVQLRTAYTENTSITEWVDDGQGWALARYNDVAHLAGL
ncbi:MAG TPA: histidine phosphatase family protein [Acidimicrobiales bacterium]|nr:histidine phosphatase family protein [Acidimicrobiales bacterium]